MVGKFDESMIDNACVKLNFVNIIFLLVLSLQDLPSKLLHHHEKHSVQGTSSVPYGELEEWHLAPVSYCTFNITILLTKLYS